MANSVADRIKDWQSDAAAADSNPPTNSTNMGDGQAGDLDGELRVLKSEMRELSLHLSWESWLGLKNLAASGNIAYTYSSGTIFTVNDNFTSASRLVAVVGRRVRAFITGATVYGTITVASFSSPTTTITVAWDSGSIDGTLTEVQFGVEPRAVGAVLSPILGDVTGTTGASIVAAIQGIPVSTTDPTTGQVMTFNGTIWIPANLPVVSDVLVGDVTGTFTASVVVKLQGIPVSTTDPTTGQALIYSGTEWAPGSLAPQEATFALSTAGGDSNTLSRPPYLTVNTINVITVRVSITSFTGGTGGKGGSPSATATTNMDSTITHNIGRIQNVTPSLVITSAAGPWTATLKVAYS